MWLEMFQKCLGNDLTNDVSKKSHNIPHAFKFSSPNVYIGYDHHTNESRDMWFVTWKLTRSWFTNTKKGIFQSFFTKKNPDQVFLKKTFRPEGKKSSTVDNSKRFIYHAFSDYEMDILGVNSIYPIYITKKEQNGVIMININLK